MHSIGDQKLRVIPYLEGDIDKFTYVILKISPRGRCHKPCSSGSSLLRIFRVCARRMGQRTQRSPASHSSSPLLRKIGRSRRYNAGSVVVPSNAYRLRVCRDPLPASSHGTWDRPRTQTPTSGNEEQVQFIDYCCRRKRALRKASSSVFGLASAAPASLTFPLIATTGIMFL